MNIRNKRGITLVALVITIIILLILAGVAITALSGENGLLSKIKQSREKYLISETKEKLTTKLIQLQTEVTDEEQRSATIEDINRLVDEKSKYYDKEVESVKDRKENKLVKISGYYFEIDRQLNIVGNIKTSELAVTEATYKVNSINENIMNVTISIKNEMGIQKVIKPDNDEVTPADSKEKITIDYYVEDGKEYKFKVKLIGDNEPKEYTLKAKLDEKIQIKQNDSNAYPTLTENGVKINKILKIDYGKNTNNYYSLDNGNSWTKYTEEISVKKEGTILAKSVVDGKITEEIQENITMQLANDALPTNAYDGNLNTNTNNTTKKILIDSSMWGQYIYVTTVASNWHTYYIYNFNGNILSSANEQTTLIYVPENATSMNITGAIKEIRPYDRPSIENDGKIYPVLTSFGVITEKNIKISYFKSSIQKKYKMNDENWKNYDENVIVNIGDVLSVKGINSEGKETEINTCVISYATDALLGEAYDENLNTNTNDTTKKILIDSSMWGQYIYVTTVASNWHTYYIYNFNGNILSSANEQTTLIYVPENATSMNITGAIKEIRPK